jgi:hypothetical protein
LQTVRGAARGAAAIIPPRKNATERVNDFETLVF